MPGPLAIIAGAGRLPGAVAEAAAAAGREVVVFQLDGYRAELPPGTRTEMLRLERLVPLFRRLAEMRVEEVVLAGAVRRPRLDPALFDPDTAALLPRILPALEGGDDSALRAVVDLFETEGFRILGADAVAPSLLPETGVLGEVAPTAADRADVIRAAEVVAALGAADVGQGAVVAGGLVLAVETIQGTDHMLRTLVELPHPARPHAPRGVLFKAPKPGQERRVDLPTIGPDTISGARAAGLAGVAVEAGGVLLLDRERTVAAADAAGLFLWVREAESCASS